MYSKPLPAIAMAAALTIASTLAIATSASAKEFEDPNWPRVKCKDGTSFAYPPQPHPNSLALMLQARNKCFDGHGGIDEDPEKFHNPKAGLTYLDAPRPIVAIPRNQLASPVQALPEIVGILNPLIRSDDKALHLRELILKNDAEGIRKLLMSSGRIPRSTIETIRRAYIGPVAGPIIALQEEPGPCQVSSATWVYLIGGVYVTAFQENICNPEG